MQAQQNPETGKRNRFRIGAGLNFNSSWMTGFEETFSSEYRQSEEIPDNPKLGMGFILASLNYFVTDRFAVGLSPQFNSYGVRYKYFETLSHELGMTTNNRIITQNLSYFQMPVTFSYYITPYLSANAGIYVSAMLDAVRRDPGKKNGTEYDPDYYGTRDLYGENVSNNYRDADVGFVAGAAVEFGIFKIAATYMHGGLNISNLIDKKHMNRSFNMSLILNFVRVRY
jgi:hypothetical protein